tara:strand:+ start:609 stop:782 length:174 start_codon:yes stop_codon:yes gene_type:complete
MYKLPINRDNDFEEIKKKEKKEEKEVKEDKEKEDKWWLKKWGDSNYNMSWRRNKYEQ